MISWIGEKAMNIVKKYWDSVYIYILLLVPGLCACAGTYWTTCKLLGYFSGVDWKLLLVFDGSQVIYFSVALFFIYKNRKDKSYILNHLFAVKSFIVLSLFIQYNFIMYLFPSEYVWECTFIFFSCIAFMFDSRLLLGNVFFYVAALLIAHIILPEHFLPMQEADLLEVIAYRILMIVLTTGCFIVIVYLAEHFLMQARENEEENRHLIEKRLEYYKDLELLDKEIRKFRHDIKNHFICMETLIENNKIEELHSYFQDLRDDFSMQKKIFFSGNEIIDAILHHDLPHYCKEDVAITVNGVLPAIRTVSAMDLCTVFSNLLSNAIKSANAASEEMESELSIQFSSGKQFFSISVSNTIKEPIENRYVVKKLLKKKGRNHGYGIRKMKKVIERYEGRWNLEVEKQKMIITIYLPI